MSPVAGPAGSTFRADEPFLFELLNRVGKGAIQLPDFQRGWVWDDHHIRSLIASVSLSYPIGAIMLLETGGDGARFLPRPVEGVDLPGPVLPEHLILDGQQRLTSLYFALVSPKPVPTKTEKNEPIERHYYLDMAKALCDGEEREDAIVAVPPDRVLLGVFGRDVVLDLSTPEKEYAQLMFPLDLAFNQAGFFRWVEGFQEFHGYEKAKMQFVNAFTGQVWQGLQQYKVPVIELLKGTQKEAVCQVFEKVNTGGVTLSVFELVTATFAAENYRLRQDWEGRKTRLQEDARLGDVDESSFLTAVTLYSSYRNHLEHGTPVGCRRRDVLRLVLNDYRQYADVLEDGFRKASMLLSREKVFETRNLPYDTQLVPLAAICAGLGKRFDEDPVKKKLARWFWSGVFGELYGGANERRFALDVPQVITWLDGGPEPQTVVDASFTPMRLLTLRTRNSAAYKGLFALLMQRGSRDFLSGDTLHLQEYFDLAVDVHHVFPRKWCLDRGLQESKWNSVVNKAPLAARTNRFIGGDAPSRYLSRLESKKGLDHEVLDEIVQSHAMNPQHMRSDEFAGFVRDRAARLLDLIEVAMGKAISGRDSDEVIAAFGGSVVSGGPAEGAR